MPTLNEARNSVYKRLIDNYVGVPYENITFDSEDFSNPVANPWIRAAVRTNVTTQDTIGSIGNRIFRTKATVYIQIFTSINHGTRMGDILAIEASNLYNSVSFDGLNFFSSSIREMGAADKWYMHLVECDFSYDQIS